MGAMCLRALQGGWARAGEGRKGATAIGKREVSCVCEGCVCLPKAAEGPCALKPGGGASHTGECLLYQGGAGG